MKSKSKRTASEDANILKIDQLQLDRECVNQPELYYRCAAELAAAHLELDRAETNLDVVKAEVDSEVRKRPRKFGLENITEAAVKAAIITVSSYKDAEEEIHRLRYKVNLHQALVTALDHRKRMLEKLVDLHGQNYFSEPRTGNAGREAIKEAKARRAFKPLDDDDD